MSIFHSKNGFTLIELSIVLVAVGLMIGGILIGQSLIDSSRINAQVKQFQQYDIATTNFKQKYKQLPGDCNNQTCPGGMSTGNNNNYIQSGQAVFPIDFPAATFEGEIYDFFYDLSTAKMVKDPYTVSAFNYSAGATIRVYAGYTVPKAAIGRGGLLVTQSASGIWWLLRMAADKTTGNSNWNIFPYNQLTPQQALAIDAKIDDGMPSNGDVTAVYGAGTGVGYGTAANFPAYYPFWFDRSSSSCITTSNGNTTQVRNSSDTYKINSSDYVCNLQIRSDAKL